ncbi:hypothetical protein YC2023_077600 [Brassica napus]
MLMIIFMISPSKLNTHEPKKTTTFVYTIVASDCNCRDWLYPEVSTVYRIHTIRYDKRKNSSMQQFRMALSYDPLCWETYGEICSLARNLRADLYIFFDILPLPYQVSLRNPSTVFGNVASSFSENFGFTKNKLLRRRNHGPALIGKHNMFQESTNMI